MRIGVSVNGVLRDFFGQIEKTHTKYFNPEDLQEIKVRDYNLEEWVKFPQEEIVRNEIEFNPNFDEREFLKNEDELQNTEEVKDDEITVDDFVYDKCCLEIFGYADENEDGAVQTINDLDLMTVGKHEFIITSREAGRSVPATLFFLSKTGCMVQNIRFTLGTTDCWNHVDCMITDHPEILNSKPEGKLTIKVGKNFNMDIPSDYTVNTIKELTELEVFQ
jgi:hypothetical protein